jgi:fructose-1,6-bisphosphatase/inositol monophosphatase family enzyme
VALVVHVEAVIDRVTFHVGHETGDIDDGHDDDTTLFAVSPDGLLDLFHSVADTVANVLGKVTDWGPSGERDGQYRADVSADEAVLELLRRVPVGVLSEESGSENLDRDVVVVVDPLDGSTNASRGVPHFATSLCAIDADGPLVALVAHQAAPVRWWAIRGEGAWRNGERLSTRKARSWSEAVVGVSGPLPADPGWWQYRALGASAIDICLVADGTLDAFVDCSVDAHGVWDYAGALLIGREVGLAIHDANGRDLVVLDHQVRRTPVAAHPRTIDRALRVRATLP